MTRLLRPTAIIAILFPKCCFLSTVSKFCFLSKHALSSTPYLPISPAQHHSLPFRSEYSTPPSWPTPTGRPIIAPTTRHHRTALPLARRIAESQRIKKKHKLSPCRNSSSDQFVSLLNALYYSDRCYQQHSHVRLSRSYLASDPPPPSWPPSQHP